ncbi:acetamidase/formamidase family protein [Cucumibacter marinus]|uniref:acetamidase/formamidase family protein n=1 Tax=Cucumibacter marinus TaxID=1121252 RepID=UPI0003FC9D91|nr:acetamidase/formamidase family protein [Cucumibacter marinus]
MAKHFLPARPETVLHGVIDRDHPAVMTVEAGDTVEAETWAMWGNRAGPDLDLEAVKALRKAHQGRGPHALTGPVAIKGAMPGDTLRIDIERIELIDHGFNLVPPGGGRGLLAERFPQGHLVHFDLDTETMTTRLYDAVTIPLRPFLGVMGVAPAREGPHPSSAPGEFGGNIDCPDLVAGSTLFLPVWQEGAGFYLGDAHAAQGCGEVSQTGLETAARRAVLTLSVIKGEALHRPRAETGTHLITMGFDPDLKTAARQALTDMISLVGVRYGLADADAYALCSLQGDLMVTQIVNGSSGIHIRLPKAIFDAERRS